MPQTRTHYEVLDLLRSANADVIRSAYRAKVKSIHPDRGGDPAEMAAVNDAYAVLSDPDKRRIYDQELDAIATDDSIPAPAPDEDPFRNWQAPDLGQFVQPAPLDRDDEPFLAWAGTLLGMFGIATLSLIWIVAIIITGLVEHHSIETTFANLLFAVLVIIATIAVTRIRNHQTKVMPHPAYVAVIGLIAIVGIWQHSSLTGWALITWALLSIAYAEGRRVDRRYPDPPARRTS